MPEQGRRVCSVGHSNYPLQEFLNLLMLHGIECIADVRSAPYSKYVPHFNKAAIEAALGKAGIAYILMGDGLGGLPPDDEFYDDDGYVRYGRIAATETFAEGIERLLGIAAQQSVALMCGERDPAVCHRHLLIGRVLSEQGVEMIHILGDGSTRSYAEVSAAISAERNGPQPTLFGSPETAEPPPWRSVRPVRE